MATAGLIVEGLFALFGIIPDTRPAQIVRTGFALNYTSVLNVLFLGAFGVLYWLYRNRQRFGGGEGYANDPVCGMQVDVETAPARAVVSGTTYYFCSDGCRDHFLANQGHISPAGSSSKGQ
jgi:YHS domain-containing protein